MKTKLQEYFPMVRTRKEVLRELEKAELYNIFDEWEEEQQEEFLNFLTGVKGIKVLYDSFFKEIMNPETTPERIEEFLSLLLENVEIQKIGYAFPGQRSACYSADLLLRQYKRVRSEKKKKFTYRDIKSVYTIVLFENSTKEFHNNPQTYLHRFKQCSDSGIELNLLQQYIFVPLDIFCKQVQYNGIQNKLDAWLAFLSMDDIDTILSIIQKYPEFKNLYEQIYDICSNIERVVEMFSKELQELDRNTVRYMIDEMQEQIEEQKRELEETKQSLLREQKQHQEALEKIRQLENV